MAKDKQILGTDCIDLSIGAFINLIKKGYSFREIVFKGISLKVMSKISSMLKYSFYYKGEGVDIDYRSVIDGTKYILLENKVWIQRYAWLVVPLVDLDYVEKRPYLIIGEGTRIGPNCTISAANKINIGKNVLLGINVLILDHMHQYADITKPISCQGIVNKGEVVIEDNAWIAANAVIYSPNKKLIIGKNSVVAANSVVLHSVEPFSVVSGNPARVIKKYNSHKLLLPNICIGLEDLCNNISKIYILLRL